MTSHVTRALLTLLTVPRDHQRFCKELKSSVFSVFRGWTGVSRGDGGHRSMQKPWSPVSKRGHEDRRFTTQGVTTAYDDVPHRQHPPPSPSQNVPLIT
eukprot:185355-Hanusia_phi.AAC.7